jgi:inhibitor of cysteine peptidase
MRVAWSIVLCGLGCVGAPTVPSAAEVPPPITLPETGGQAIVVLGQEVALHLEANATTGYRWEVVQPVSDVVLVVDNGTYREPPDPDARVGAGGSTSFVFRAIRRGKAVLDLVYRRPWERDVAPAKIVTVNLEVR